MNEATTTLTRAASQKSGAAILGVIVNDDDPFEEFERGLLGERQEHELQVARCGKVNHYQRKLRNAIKRLDWLAAVEL